MMKGLFPAPLRLSVLLPACLAAGMAMALPASPAGAATLRTAAPAAGHAAGGPEGLLLRVKDEPRTHRGEASYYHDRFHGREMANGETFRQGSDSAASRTLPLGTRAQVKNLENGRTAEVTIEDRGPYARGRVIDLSKNTARQLDMMEDGTAPVEVRPLPGGKRD